MFTPQHILPNQAAAGGVRLQDVPDATRNVTLRYPT